MLLSFRFPSLRTPFLLSFTAGALLLAGCSSDAPGPTTPTSSSGGPGSSSGGSSGGSGGSGATVQSQCDQVGAAECQHLLVDCTTPADSGGATVSDQCTEIGKVLCAQAVACGTATSADSCLTTVVTSCCGSTTICSAQAASGENVIATCKTDISAQSCSQATAGLPSSCKGIVKPVANADTTASCKQQMEQACCGKAGVCGSTASSSQDSISACTSAIGSSTCASSSSLPSACQGVVKVASVPIHPDAFERGESGLGAALNALH